MRGPRDASHEQDGSGDGLAGMHEDEFGFPSNEHSWSTLFCELLGLRGISGRTGMAILVTEANKADAERFSCFYPLYPFLHHCAKRLKDADDVVQHGVRTRTVRRGACRGRIEAWRGSNWLDGLNTFLFDSW